MTTKKDVLDTAIAAVADRGLNYGKPEDNFVRIANLWNAHIVNCGWRLKSQSGEIANLDPSDVAVMMVLLKVARLENDSTHFDSWVDIAGYAACGGEITGD